jgi:hypothetical protein
MDERCLPDPTRRAGVEAFPIRLADGNSWGLALPTTRLKPRVTRCVDSLGRPTETMQVETEYGYPLEIRRLVDDLRIACDRESAEIQHAALFRLAAALIRRVHDLERDDLADLLEMDLEELPRFVATVLSVVTGECLENSDSPRKREADV